MVEARAVGCQACAELLPRLEKAEKALFELRQQVEHTVIVAETEEDDHGWITAYHFKTGAIHRLLAKARE
jgi:hypothetical protein